MPEVYTRVILQINQSEEIGEKQSEGAKLAPKYTYPFRVLWRQKLIFAFHQFHLIRLSEEVPKC